MFPMGGIKMRHDTAVSEVLGAVFLIGIVIIAIAIIGTSLLSQPPAQGSNYPKATIGTYCVECAGTYEIIVKHDGGEAFPTKVTDFSVNNKLVSADDIKVYTQEPPECSVKTSRGGTEYSWNTLDLFGPGMIAKIVVNKGLDDTVDDIPSSITILYNNQPGPGGVGTQFFQKIKNQSISTYNTDTGSEIEKIQELMTGKFEPKLEPNSTTGPDDDGYCTAVFYYSNSLDMILKVAPCTGDAMILDSNGNLLSGETCAQPWNEFVGVGPGDYSWLKKNMGQPIEFYKNDESNKTQRSFTIKFKNGIQWRLANGVSATAICEGSSCNCKPQETCIWGYMFYDLNGNGIKDSDEPGFTDGVITITGRNKNNPNTPNTQYDALPDQTGIWKSRCIQMSGWSFDIVASLPPGYSTSNNYMNYDEKMTGQDKKNPPRLDFAVTGTPFDVTPTPPPPTITPTPVPTVIPVNLGGVGAQLYSGGNDEDVIVEFAFSSAGYKNVFKLSSPKSIDLGWSQGEMPNNRIGTAIGTTWNLGKFSKDTELIFADTADGKTYYTGPASRNPDKIEHGAVTYIGTVDNNHKYLVTFEDYYGGGDKDYNDLEFYVTGNLYVLSSSITPAPTPTPSPDTIPPSISGVSASLSSNKKIVTIRWTASDNVGINKVVIRISTDGGTSYPNIIRDSSWTTNPGKTKSDSFAWKSNMNYSSAKFKVIVYDNADNTAFGVTDTIRGIKKY
jgi:FlaG/FlaF family flagellin (archaellin)